APATTSRPFQSRGNRNRNRAWPSGSEAMRALICNPGTAFVIGVRLGASGEITPRSVIGVKPPAGTPGNELLAGVVGFVAELLLVVRSGLSKHFASARSLDSALSTSSQVSLACAENAMENRKTAVLQLRRIIVSSPNVVRRGCFNCSRDA